ncbi:unnamed protein product, partial [Meganyctiphanes norvegica]
MTICSGPLGQLNIIWWPVPVITLTGPKGQLSMFFTPYAAHYTLTAFLTFLVFEIKFLSDIFNFEIKFHQFVGININILSTSHSPAVLQKENVSSTQYNHHYDDDHHHHHRYETRGLHRFRRQATSSVEAAAAGDAGSNSNSLSTVDVASLGRLLTTFVNRVMPSCVLAIIYDQSFADSPVLNEVMNLPNTKQLVYVRPSNSSSDLSVVLWASRECRGYIMLLENLEPLVQFGKVLPDQWDYQGKYVIVSPSVSQLDEFCVTDKGRKTEQIAGIVKAKSDGVWSIYMNILYWRTGMMRNNVWRRNNFTQPLDPYPDKISNLRGATLTAITFEWEPSVLYLKDKQGNIIKHYGIDIEVMNAISKTLNFKLDFQEPPPGELWGSNLDDGSWNGMVGKLASNEGDMGAANLFLTLKRNGVVDYSQPYDAEVSCFMARTMPPEPKWKALMLPFAMETWGVLFIFGIFMGALLCFLANASNQCGGEDPGILSLEACMLYSVSVHMRESHHVVPIRVTTQLFILFFWFYAVILTTAYCSNLTAFLTIESKPDGIETVQQLHAAGLEVSSLGPFFKGALSSAVDPYLKELADRFVPYDSLGVVFPRVLAGDSFYLHNRQFLEYIITTEFTNGGSTSMRIMKECFAPYNIAMALQRNSPLKRKFDKVILWMIESGLVRRWFLESLRADKQVKQQEKKENSDGKSEDAEDDGGLVSLGLDHMQGAFFLLVIMLVMSILVFFLELCFFRIRFGSYARRPSGDVKKRVINISDFDGYTYNP